MERTVFRVGTPLYMVTVKGHDAGLVGRLVRVEFFAFMFVTVF